MMLTHDPGSGILGELNIYRVFPKYLILCYAAALSLPSDFCTIMRPFDTSIALVVLMGIANAEHYPDISRKSHIIHPLPHTYISENDLPQSFTWQNVNGNSYLTRMKNQHIPQC